MADSSNTARNFILTGALLGIGAAAAGVYIMNTTNLPGIDTRVETRRQQLSLTKEAVELKERALAERVLKDVAPEGAAVPRLGAKDGAEPRYTPLFFAPKLWMVTTPAGREVRDLMNAKSQNVHDSVPNSEFFKYGLEGIIGRSDALDMDVDGDGFTNGEEFAAGTNPNDKTSMPPFATKDGAKMVWVRLTDEKHTLVLGSSYTFTGEISISVHDWVGGVMKPARSDKWDLKVGDAFGLSRSADKGSLAKDRFRVTAQGEDASGKFLEIEDTYTKVENHRRFKLYPGDSKKRDVSDVSVVLAMTAGAQKGEALKTPVQLGEDFDVPGFEGVKCTLTKATPKNVTITVDGIQQPIKLKKLPTPPKNKQ